MKNCTIFPTTNGWASARSTGDAFLTDTNCAIIVNQPIHNLSKVLINGDEIAITYFYEDQTPWISGHVSDLYVNGVKLQGLDITRYVLEYDVYQTRDIILKNGNDDPYAYIGNIVRNNTCYYKQNENVIYLVNDGFGQYNKGYNFSAMVTSAVYWLMAHSENVTAKDEKGVFHKVIFHTTEEIKKYSSIDPRDFTFRVYYTPLGESVALTVPKTEPQEHQFTIPVSQQQPIVSSQAYGKNLQSLANRTGVAVRIVKRKVYTLDQIRKLGSYWQETDKDGNRTGNIYTLTSQEIVLQGGYAICTERWSKNWMMQSEYVGINREFRSWNIPADIVQRNLHYQDYCYITSDKDFDKDGKFTKDCDLTD
ncbi:MAG: hypothetical protein J1G02_06395, partial [Clostridiales bacterium]|nr:hypothetical protein [Clostridiales bacterium]